MEVDNDILNFVPRIDNGPMRQDAEETKDILRGIGASAEEVGQSMAEALSRAIHSVYGATKRMGELVAEAKVTAQAYVTDVVDIADAQADQLKQAFQRGYHIDDASLAGIRQSIQIQQQYLEELKRQYGETQAAIAKVAPGEAFSALNDQLVEQKKVIDEETQSLLGMQVKYNELSASTLVDFNAKVSKTVGELAVMRIRGEQNTEQYKALEDQLGKLALAQLKVDAGKKSAGKEPTQWAGLIEGLQGLMSAYSAGSKVVGLFSKDQEKLMRVQAKMQSVMSVLMDLQKVANVLSADSAFRVKTLAKAQELYTLALNKTKVALLSGSVAARTFKIALASTGVGLFVMAIGGLVSAFAQMKERAKASAKEMEAFKKSLDIKYAGGGEVAKATAEMDAYRAVLTKTNLSQLEERKVIDELNAKYGGIIGKYQTKAEWLDALNTKTEDYINTLRLQAQVEEATKQAMEAADKEEEARKKVDEEKKKNQSNIDAAQKKVNEAKLDYEGRKVAGTRGQQYSAKVNLESAEKELQKALEGKSKGLKKANEEYEEAVKKREAAFAKLGELGAQLKGKQLSLPGSTQATAEELQKQLDDIEQVRLAGLRSISADEIALMQEGKAKKLAEIEAERADLLAALEKEKKDLDEQLKEAGQGGLSATDKANYATREAQINARQDAKVAGVEKENAEAIAKMYRDLGDVFATEEQKKVAAIKRRYDEQREQLLKQKEGGSISEALYIDLSANVDRAEAKETFDYWLSEYGNYDQKRKVLDDEWQARLKDVPPAFAAEAQRQMTEALSKLDFEQFKKTIDWSGVSGDLGKQSSEAIKYNLSQIQAYLEGNKLNMGAEEIKEVQQTITALTGELESRNPFAGFVNAIQGISAAKSQAVDAINAIKEANDDLNAAKEERRLAEEELAMYENETDAEGETDIAEAKAEAQKRLSDAIQGVATAEKNKDKAVKQGLSASNAVTASYRKMSQQMNGVKGEVLGVANNVKALAAVFSDEVADGIGKAIDLFDALFSAATDVVDAVGNTSKHVTAAITDTVEASSTAMTTTSTTAVAGIKSMETASVILAVISAALQVATAIAKLIKTPDQIAQEHIESLQERIDQLQWEIDNAATIRMQGGEGAESVVDEIRQKYIDAAGEIGQAWDSTVGAYIDGNLGIDANKFQKGLGKAEDAFNLEKAKIVSKELVKDFSDIEYSADKVFGDDYWNQASQNAQKYAEQMVLMEEQLAAEKGKKKTDDDKVKEYEQGIAEIKQKINDEFNGVIDEIIGGSYQDIAEQLGDAFFEAFRNGEDAAAAWGKAVDKIVADVIKKMFIQQFLTENIAKIFDKYKGKWFNEDGSFVGWDAFQATMGEFSSDLKGASSFALEAFENMPDDVKELFYGDAERSGSSKGIASISQDSADEMNGRMTAIQGHTYAINESTKQLVVQTASILSAVIDIRAIAEDMYELMGGMGRAIGGVETNLRAVRMSVHVQQVRGVAIR